MKIIKFTSELVPLVISEEKYVTWRLFDDKNLSVGDNLEFVNKDTGEIFGYSIILNVVEKKLRDVGREDYDGHEKFSDKETMIATYKKYYGDRVNEDTIVKVIRFSFKAK